MSHSGLQAADVPPALLCLTVTDDPEGTKSTSSLLGGGGVIFFFFSSGRFQRPLRWSNSSNKKRLEAELVLQTVEIISVCLRVNEDHPTMSHT